MFKVFNMVSQWAYRKGLYGRLTNKPFNKMTDDEIKDVYNRCLINKHHKNDKKIKALNDYLLKSGRIELFK